ncbi:MAG: DUF58 domain-containing protein [Croceibacterium sp.]
MITPTRAAVLATAAGAPVALAVAVLMPERWYAGLAWPVAVVFLTLFDALAGAAPRAASVELKLPRFASVGSAVEAEVTVVITGSGLPSAAEVALAPDPLLEMENEGRLWVILQGGRGTGLTSLVPRRRGIARIGRLWVRWRGRLGLVWKQRTLPCDGQISIHPDLEAARTRGAQLFERNALQGLLTQMFSGEGTEFEALVEYRSGMDRRAIDWKQSARHIKLHAKEHRVERNEQIVFAVDAGRQMSDPVAGLPRVDRAVSAVLLNAWVALKLGDRVALHAVDSRPRLASGFVAGPGAFGELQRMAAQIDYSGEETNYTFALTTLAAKLQRRSMVVLLTEFTDLISAEFLVRAATTLLRKHLLLVVVLRDEELESIAERAPETTDDVTRAVTAAALLKERLLVLTRLRHIGAHVVESEHDRVGDRLVAAYIDLKRRNLL